MKRDSGVWLRLMLIAFVANGLGPFGLKLLNERSLAAFQSKYLVYRYLGARSLASSRWRVAYARGRAGRGHAHVQPRRPVAYRSRAGASGVPGHVVFPLTTGGSLFLVAAAGILGFREKVGEYGIAGILSGILSLIILSAG